MIKKILMATLITSTFALASELYAPTKNIDTGITNTLNSNTLIGKKALAHTTVYFDENGMTKASEEKLNSILSQKHVARYVSIIGHSSEVFDDVHSVKLSGWAEFWQNLGSSAISSTETVNDRLHTVYKYLQENNVPATNIYNENRMDADPVSTEATAAGRTLNNRVDVTFYN